MKVRRINAVMTLVISALFFHVFSIERNYSSMEETIAEVQELATSAESTASTRIKSVVDAAEETVELADESVNSALAECEINFAGLCDINKDVAAWIRFEDGKIDLPILDESKKELDYYLHHDIYGEDSSAGTLFVENTDNVKNRIIYGHNMKNGSMFGSLKFLVWDKNALQNPKFTIWTVDGVEHLYEIVSIAVTKENSSLYQIPESDDEYDSYVDLLLSAGEYSNVDAEGLSTRNDLVTLSTCYGKGSKERLIVVAVET